MELRDYNRRAAEALKAVLCAIHDPLETAREAFLAMIADAGRWEEDVDGEYHADSPVPTITVTYHLTTDRHQLEELVDALGFQRAFGEGAGEAIQRELYCEECAEEAIVRASAEDPSP